MKPMRTKTGPSGKIFAEAVFYRRGSGPRAVCGGTLAAQRGNKCGTNLTQLRKEVINIRHLMAQIPLFSRQPKRYKGAS
jgi:hypothetical protein